jgi:hypothetical protein
LFDSGVHIIQAQEVENADQMPEGLGSRRYRLWYFLRADALAVDLEGEEAVESVVGAHRCLYLDLPQELRAVVFAQDEIVWQAAHMGSPPGVIPGADPLGAPEPDGDGLAPECSAHGAEIEGDELG